MNRYKIKVFIISLIVVFAVALIGSAFTSGRTSGEWYESIRAEITPLIRFSDCMEHSFLFDSSIALPFLDKCEK
jgi:flagellar basal body-associated protein FliL